MTATFRRHLATGAVTFTLLLAGCSTTGTVEPTAAPTTTTEADEPETTTTEAETTTTEEERTTTTEAPSDDIRDEIIEEMARSFLEEDDVPIDDLDTARCISAEFVETLDPEAAANDPDYFDDYVPSEAEALKLARAFTDCGADLSRLLTDALESEGLTRGEARCVVDEFGTENIERVFAMGMIDGDTTDLERQLDAATAACT